jgi:hypothetical protein
MIRQAQLSSSINTVSDNFIVHLEGRLDPSASSSSFREIQNVPTDAFARCESQHQRKGVVDIELRHQHYGYYLSCLFILMS